MRRRFLFLILMSFAGTTAQATAPLGFEEEAWPDFREKSGSYAKTNLSTSASMVPSPLINEDKLLGSSYYDTLSILSSANNCSDFFGGPDASVDVFKRLMGRLRKEHNRSDIGMRMSGETTTVFNARTKARYRLFDQVSINTQGAFYKNRYSNAEPSIPRVGSFEPNTDEARMLIFLHELGHLVRGPDGKWLLPNDGNDENLSRNNTAKVEEVCGDEIKSAAKGEAGLKVDTETMQER